MNANGCLSRSTQTVEVVVATNGISRHLEVESNKQAEQVLQAMGDMLAVRRCSHIDVWQDLSREARCTVSTDPDYWPRDGSRHTVLSLRADGRRCWLVYGPLFTWSCLWWADMLPVDGPVLGPFLTRKEACSEEKKWLLSHNLPLPGSNKC